MDGKEEDKDEGRHPHQEECFQEGGVTTLVEVLGQPTNKECMAITQEGLVLVQILDQTARCMKNKTNLEGKYRPM